MIGSVVVVTSMTPFGKVVFYFVFFLLLLLDF